MLVFFGTLCPGEIATEILHGRPRSAFRRFKRDRTSARLAGQAFDIVYHRSIAIQESFAPWFELERRLGVGIAVPPSAAEPWISRHPRLLAVMEAIDQRISRSLAFLGDHILYLFRRTSVE